MVALSAQLQHITVVFHLGKQGEHLLKQSESDLCPCISALLSLFAFV